MRPDQIRLIQSVFASQRGWQWLLFYLLPPVEGAVYLHAAPSFSFTPIRSASSGFATGLRSAAHLASNAG